MSCEDCQLSKNCKNSLMMGKGNHNADYMIVLDSPTWQDDRSNQFLKGDYAKKLRYLLRKAGINHRDCYVTSAVKCPVKDKQSIGKRNHHKDEEGKKVKGKTNMEECRKYLLHEIKKVKPKVIITMGRYAHETFTSKTSYKEYSGFFYPFSMSYKVNVGEETQKKNFSCKIIPTHCPNASLHAWKNDIYTIHHLKKAKRFAETGDENMRGIPDFKRVESIKELKEFIKASKKSKKYGHDFETTGLHFYKNDIINSGYCFDGKTAWIIYLIENWPESHQKKFSPEQKKEVKKITTFYKKNKKTIDRVLKSIHGNKATKIGANHKFDKKFARKRGFPFKRATEDTTVKEALIDENRVKSLNACLEIRDINFGPYDTALYEYVGKDKKKKKPYTYIPPSLLDKYLAVDVVGVYILNEIQDDELEQEGQKELYEKQQTPLLEELYRIEYRGFLLDKKLIERDIKISKERVDKYLKEFKKLAKDDNFNPNSPAQVSALMESHNYPFDRLGFNRGKTGWPTGEKVLKAFLKYKKWKKIPEMLIEYRGLTKLKNTYICNDKQDSGIYTHLTDKNKVHTTFNAFIPVTGRLSSDSPNIQNQPNPRWGINIRNYFIAPYDWVIWECDFSALEMKIACLLSGDPVMYEEISKGVDMHSANSVYFGPILGFLDKSVTYDDFKLIAKLDDYDEKELIKKYSQKEFDRMNSLHPKYSKLRAFSKSVGFGLFYGQEAITFSEEHDVEIEKVDMAIDAYWKKYKYVHKFLEKSADDAVKKGLLTIPLTGRKRRFLTFSEWINSSEAEGIWNPDMYKSAVKRQAKNFPIQGFANEVFTQKVIKLIKALRKLKMKSKVNNLIHDGIVGIGPLSEMREVEKLCHDIMTTKIKKNGRTIILNVDFNVNTRWYGKRIKNY